MSYKRSELKEVRQRTYLAKDFDGLRANLLDYARRYYPNRMQDFSEMSTGGLLLDLACVVGDNLSFYLDHQYSELNSNTAVELNNIQTQLRSAGVSIVGAAPAVVKPTIYIEVPAQLINNVTQPMDAALPIINSGTVFMANNGTEFILLDDVDFSSTNSDGTPRARTKIGQKTTLNQPLTYVLSMECTCISGKEASESFQIGTSFVPFRRLTLSQASVSEIISVVDSLGNTYHRVNSLTHDVVYRNVLNTASDNELVPGMLKVVPAPYRFTADTDLTQRKTTLTFGGGNANTLEDDVIPDPSEFAISFPYSKTFSRYPINPEQLLETKTLGVAATGCTLTVTYRYGGGLNHNVPQNNVQAVKQLKMTFPRNPSASIAARVRSSVEVNNAIEASGAEDAPTVDELRALIPSARNMQERIVSRPDLLARVYTLPTNFGRAFRVAVGSNPSNPLASQLFVVSRNNKKQLVTSPDTLKQNLVKYLNPYRLISDAIDVLDARIINIQVLFDVLIDPSLNRSTVLQSVLLRLQNTFDIKNFHIGQPIVRSNIINTIYSTPGIMAVNELRFDNVIGTFNNRTYSDVTFDVGTNTRHGIIFPPQGGIFECRYPEVDIIGRASV